MQCFEGEVLRQTLFREIQAVDAGAVYDPLALADVLSDEGIEDLATMAALGAEGLRRVAVRAVRVLPLAA
ncbi:MAG: hypothetical protein H6983_03115 [Ectothiorhodospiraceae bacterium]|nr:hypothetical protein [Ectothiorhodospiraceae bacterium]